MKKITTKTIVTLLLMWIGANQVTLADEIADLEIIKERYILNLIESTPDQETLENYLNELDIESGAWGDIDYLSTIGSGWDTNDHPARIADIAKYYRLHEEKLSQAEKERLLEAIHSTWGYWFREKPHCTTNWYPNVLACPKQLTYSFLLMQEEMTDEEMAAAEKIVFNKTVIQKTGANLIGSANIVLCRSLIKNDPELARTAIDAILSTVCISPQGVDGIQPDFSYQLHGPQQQFGNYGVASLNTGYSTYSNLFKGTSYAFSEEQMDMLANYLSDGYRWIMWRGYMDVNATGRQHNPGHYARKGADILAVAQKVARACNDEQSAKIYSMIEENTQENPTIKCGHKSFYCSDGMYHHTSTWAASLKMSSYRVVGSEQGDNNLKGYYLADGAFYTYVDGDEYENSVVLWDWHKVPGITCYDRETTPKSGFNRLPRNQSDFVGTCSDGESGITTMVLNRDSLYANKTWVMTDDFALCIGCGIGDYSGEATLTTSIDQKLAKNDLLYLNKNKWRKIDGRNIMQSDDMRFFHDKTGYIVLDNIETEAIHEHRKGDWADISRSIVLTDAEGDIFSLFVRHTEQGAKYRYLILPARTKEQVAEFDISSVEVLNNNEQIQLVKYKDQYYATVYQRGFYEADGLTIRVMTPGIYMFNSLGGDDWEVIAHDPKQNLSDDEIRSHLLIL